MLPECIYVPIRCYAHRTQIVILLLDGTARNISSYLDQWFLFPLNFTLVALFKLDSIGQVLKKGESVGARCLGLFTPLKCTVNSRLYEHLRPNRFENRLDKRK